MIVEMADGTSVNINLEIQGCPFRLGPQSQQNEYWSRTDFHEIPMKNQDVILGMNWIKEAQVKIEAHQLEARDQEGKKFTIKIRKPRQPNVGIINSQQLNEILQHESPELFQYN